MSRRNITDEFRAEAVQLVVAQGYSFASACEALGIGDTALRRWVAQWRAEQAEPPRTEVQLCIVRHFSITRWTFARRSIPPTAWSR